MVERLRGEDLRHFYRAYMYGKKTVLMIQKMEHIGLRVKDLSVSTRFYVDVLGMRVVGKGILENGLDLVFLAFSDSDTIQLELIGNGQDDVPATGKIDHFAFTVSDIESEMARLRTLGISFIDETPRAILGGIKIAFFYGPDGERLEFFQPK
jgi:lactoylglutathione lyase